jgi:hypothetical protein
VGQLFEVHENIGPKALSKNGQNPGDDTRLIRKRKEKFHAALPNNILHRIRNLPFKSIYPTSCLTRRSFSGDYGGSQSALDFFQGRSPADDKDEMEVSSAS